MASQFPQLNQYEMLPVGVYDCALDVVEKMFGQIRRSTRRHRLFGRLREYVEALRAAEIPGWVIVDGSFVMGCVEEPDDIDLILVLSAEWARAKELRPFEYNLIGKKQVRVRYGFDLFLVDAGSDAEMEWIAFFQQTNPKWRHLLKGDLPDFKGLVRVTI